MRRLQFALLAGAAFLAILAAASVALDTMSNPLLAVVLYVAAFACVTTLAITTETDQS